MQKAPSPSASNFLYPSEQTDIKKVETGVRCSSATNLKWTDMANRPATAPVKARGLQEVKVNVRPRSGGLRGNRMYVSNHTDTVFRANYTKANGQTICLGIVTQRTVRTIFFRNGNTLLLISLMARQLRL